MIDELYALINSNLWVCLGVLLVVFILYTLGCVFMYKIHISFYLLVLPSAILLYIVVQGILNSQGPTGDSIADGLASIIPVLGSTVILIFPFLSWNPFSRREENERKDN